MGWYMDDFNDYRLQKAYNSLLFRWKDIIQNLEDDCQKLGLNLSKPFQTQLHVKLENLKSYYYSFKYFTYSEEADTEKRVKELLTEMKG